MVRQKTRNTEERMNVNSRTEDFQPSMFYLAAQTKILVTVRIQHQINASIIQCEEIVLRNLFNF